MNLHSHYDTADIASPDRFAYWREAVCDSYVQLGCEATNTSNFNGSLDVHRHSVLSISHVTGMAHIAERRKRDIRAASDEYFLLSLQRAKTSRITQFGKTSVLRAGDMALYDSSDPYKLELSDGFAKTVVQLPKSKLLARLPNAQSLVAHRIDGQSGIGQLVRDNILAFANHAQEENPMLQSMVQATLIDLIATGLANQIGQWAELSSPEQHVLLRAKSFIRGNLGDPDLDRNRVASEIGMSIRRLNAIFAKEDQSIAEYIRNERLNAVAADLSDARFKALSISEIAIKFGFSNLQHFSTLFKETFGSTPKIYRSLKH